MKLSFSQFGYHWSSACMVLTCCLRINSSFVDCQKVKAQDTMRSICIRLPTTQSQLLWCSRGCHTGQHELRPVTIGHAWNAQLLPSCRRTAPSCRWNGMSCSSGSTALQTDAGQTSSFFRPRPRSKVSESQMEAPILHLKFRSCSSV